MAAVSATSKRSKSNRDGIQPSLDYPAVAVELLRALRGSRSRAEFSRRMGYRSNVAHRWETRRSWPTAARYLQMQRRVHPEGAGCFERFFQRPPSWPSQHVPESPEGVAAFLRELRGKAPIGSLAQLGGFSRYRVSRWLSGATQPSLPEFLCFVEVASRRGLDFIALCAEPSLLPSVARRWRALEAARAAAYQRPWSHAVLRALEIEPQPQTARAQVAALALRLGIDTATVEAGLEALREAGQVSQRRGRFVVETQLTINTSQDREHARKVKAVWTRTALERLEQGSAGNFGYSLFAISRSDLRRLRDLHLEYVRAMQELIARSQPSECVALYCSQLLDLAGEDNVLSATGQAAGADSRVAAVAHPVRCAAAVVARASLAGRSRAAPCWGRRAR
jgi:DNA-binding MarR family transcriptional regulator